MNDTDYLSLRPTTAADVPFLLTVYAGTRLDELAMLPWNLQQKEAFILMQFNAQKQHYSMAYPDADYHIIFVNDQPVGRLIVDRAAASLTLIDISLLPADRGRGIGTRVLNELLSEARSFAKPVLLYVELTNPAKRLYERLGFFAEQEDALYCQMKWIPNITPSQTTN
jgi:ribosomal protein S18 acetylase RimI-like enzyme